MASRSDIEKAFQLSGIGRGPTDAEYKYYGAGSWPDAGRVEGDIRGGNLGNISASGDPIAQSIEDSFRRLQQEVVKRFGEYKGGKPFKIDEVLADKTKQASEQIDPYYNETLSDYLTGVTRKISRSTQDTQDLVTELTADTRQYTEQSRQNLSEAILKAQEGFADAGLFDSGSRLRTEGLATANSANNLANFNRGQDFKIGQAQTGLNRNLEDIGLNKKIDVRNIERSRFTDTQNLAGTLAKEEGQRYIQGFQQTLPNELKASSGFDLLKDLGIYS